jgi:predicted membrane protein
MFRRYINLASLLVLLAVMAGCATVNTVPIQTLEPVAGFPYSAMVLDVAENVVEDVHQESVDLQFMILERLKRVP